MTVKKFAFADKLRHMPHVLYTNVRGQTGRKHWMEYNMRLQGMKVTRIELPPVKEMAKDFDKMIEDFHNDQLLFYYMTFFSFI